MAPWSLKTLIFIDVSEHSEPFYAKNIVFYCIFLITKLPTMLLRPGQPSQPQPKPKPSWGRVASSSYFIAAACAQETGLGVKAGLGLK